MSKRDSIEQEMERERKELQVAINKEIGRIVQAYRKYNNISSVDLAYNLRISRSHLGKIERGAVTTNFQTLLQLNCLIGKELDFALEHAKSDLDLFMKKHNLYDL